MKNKLIPYSIILIFLIIFAVFYKSLKDTNIYTPETKINNDIPIFSADLLLLNENSTSTEIFELDKFYLLNIWASWCAPCRDEHPILMSLSKNNKLNIIGMNYKDNKKNAKSFLAELGNPYEKIIVDNVLWHGEVADEKNNDKFTLNIREFNKFVSEDKRVEQIIIPLGDGMTVCRVL